MQEIFNKITELIKTNDNIYIMTHHNPDFDGMSSCIALQQIINKFNKKSYIIKNFNDNNKSLNKAYNYMKQKEIQFNFISKSEALKDITEENLLIILDTQKENLLEVPELLTKTQKIVLIDHHIKNKTSIDNGILSYINVNLSSIAEFISDYMKYLNFNLEPLVATFLMVGLEIDTNNFRLKTTEKTYETAAFLTKLGASSIIKQELLQEEKEIYIKRQKLIAKSYMINSKMAICTGGNEIYSNQDLASIAEKVIQFENVEASFVIGKLSDNLIGISARSIGTVNVEDIMAKLGGGGHLNEAATQLSNVSIDNAKDQLLNIIGG